MMELFGISLITLKFDYKRTFIRIRMLDQIVMTFLTMRQPVFHGISEKRQRLHT